MKILQKKNVLITIIVMSIVWLTCIFTPQINKGITKFFMSQNIATRKDNLIVHFISVGQGDAIAINLPDGKIVLIDAGTVDYAVDYTKYLYDNVLSNSKDKNIDCLILSHADKDHFGGAKRLMQEFDIEQIILPYYNEDKEDYKDLISSVENNEIPTKSVDEIDNLSAKNYKIKLFYIEEDETNASSTVVKLEYKGTKFLFTGDIDIETEHELVSKYGDEMDCDILKVAHHGSKMSTSKEFLSEASPEHAVISCDKNSYGHPTDTVLKNLAEIGAKIHRTDTDGNMVFVVDNKVGLFCLKDDYNITNLWFNYAIFVLIVEILIIIKVVVEILIVLKKKHTSKKLLVKKS